MTWRSGGATEMGVEVVAGFVLAAILVPQGMVNAAPAALPAVTGTQVG
jgi:hypothetical protein